MTLYAAFGGGLGGFIGNIMGGKLLDMISVFSIYKILSLVMVFALLVVSILKGMDKRNYTKTSSVLWLTDCNI